MPPKNDPHDFHQPLVLSQCTLGSMALSSVVVLLDLRMGPWSVQVPVAHGLVLLATPIAEFLVPNGEAA